MIMGAGISGISAAWHLQDRCPSKSYVILERRQNLGGTWVVQIPRNSIRFRHVHPGLPLARTSSVRRRAAIMDYSKRGGSRGTASTSTSLRPAGCCWRTGPPRTTRRSRSRATGSNGFITASFLFARSGYSYNYDEGYSPDFAGAADFGGTISCILSTGPKTRLRRQTRRRHRKRGHRCHLDSALANSGVGYVTMLQRSPTYIGAPDDVDLVAERTMKVLFPASAYRVNRLNRIIIFQWVQYRLARRSPTSCANNS